MIGTRVAHYEIIDKLGEGGMGEVYRAHDSKLGREVAIKVLPDLFLQDEERLARFEREARMLAALDHANIAAIYGLEEQDGQRFLIMQLAEGETLQERIKRGRLPVPDALKIARQIAEALESAHAKGIIHRDLKPANVKIDSNGQVKVLDFGLAKAIEGDRVSSGSHPSLMESPTLTAQMTGKGVLLGTAAYMSPEQARGEAADKRADLWSFGVVVWEMLTGNQLFVGKTMSDTLAGVLRDEPDLEALPAETPPAIRRLLRRCLEREVHERLPDAATARLEIEDALTGRGDVEAITESAATTAPGWQRILPWALLAAAVLAVIGLWLTKKPVDTSPHRLVRLSSEISTEPFYVELGSSVVLSPDGSQIAHVSVGSDGVERLWIRSLDQLDSLRIAEGQQGDQPYHPFFSPDGKWLGFVTPSELKKVPVTGGTPITLCDVDRSRGATWTDRDLIVFAPSGSETLFTVPAAGGDPKPLTTLASERKEVSHRWPFALPGGKTVLYTIGLSAMTRGFDDASIAAVDVDTGESKVLVSGGYYARYVPTGHLVYIRDATLFGVPFDPELVELTGSPAPIVQGVLADNGPGGAQYSFSADGTLVYVAGTVELPQYPVSWVDRKGSVSTLWETEGTYASPAMSPDGRRVAFSVVRDGNWDVWVYDIGRGVATRLTFYDGYDADQIWSPDGEYLIFSSDRDGEARPYRKRADGSGDVEPLGQGEANFYPTSVSPDGHWLIGELQANNIDIAVLDIEAKSKPETFLGTDFLDRDPSYSPDGRWVAYASNESGNFEIYVRPFPAAGGRWQVSDGGGRFPRWSGDGSELFYRTNEGLMVADVKASGDSFEVGKARTLFEGDFRGGMFGIAVAGYVFIDYAVAPDGEHFVMFPGSKEESGQTHATLVFNWFDELERTLPNSN